jgi:hypothetical protein
MKQKEATSKGIGFLGLLGLVFITLKLTGHIQWAWWWVLAPLWGPLALALAVMLVLLLVAGLLFLLGVGISVYEKLTKK